MWWERISTAKTNFSNNNYQQPTDRIEQSSAANVSREQSSCCKVYEFRIGKVNFVRQFWCCCAICNNADCTFNYNNNCNTWTDCSSRIQIAHTLTLNFLAERRLQWKKSLSSHHFEWAQQQLTPQQQKERERNAATAAAEVAAATLTSTLFLISAAAEKSVWGAERRTLQLFDRKNSLKHCVRLLVCVWGREEEERSLECAVEPTTVSECLIPIAKNKI